MYVDDVIIISYLLKCNLLGMFSNTYLSHIPFTGCNLRKENYSIILNTSNASVQIKKNCTIQEEIDSLKQINIGEYIQEVARKNEITEHDIAKQIGRSHSLIRDIYKRKSMKIKPLIKISDALMHNLLTEVYISRMSPEFSFYLFDGCIFELYTKDTNIGKSFLLKFR
jgi:hypothetical protein